MVFSDDNFANTDALTQQVMNNIVNDTNIVCKATCTENAQGNIIVINGGSVGGDINLIREQCSAAASCVINNSTDTEVQNILSSITNQSNSTDGGTWGLLQFANDTNNVTINQNIRNYITQMTNVTCSSSVALNATDNFIYVANTNVGGDINGVILGDDSTNANSNCTITNLSKVSAYNNQQANVTQSNTQTGIIALIIMVIIFFLLFAGLILILLVATGSLGRIFGGARTSNVQVTPAAPAVVMKAPAASPAISKPLVKVNAK